MEVVSKKKKNPDRDNYNPEFDRDALILPPGTLNNQKIYGRIKLRIGNIVYQKNQIQKEDNENGLQRFDRSKFRVKFWGQTSHVILVAQNCSQVLRLKNKKQYSLRE